MSLNYNKVFEEGFCANFRYLDEANRILQAINNENRNFISETTKFALKANAENVNQYVYQMGTQTGEMFKHQTQITPDGIRFSNRALEWLHPKRAFERALNQDIDKYKYQRNYEQTVPNPEVQKQAQVNKPIELPDRNYDEPDFDI